SSSSIHREYSGEAFVTPASFNGRELGLELESKNTERFLGPIRVYRDRLGSMGTYRTLGR
ncbi:hypothetical protein LINGRAHAP2_LOCUS6823, partial [Linum grandiflorum]